MFQGRSFDLGSICNALACRGVEAPHTGKPYSEALLLGVSGGVTFGYMVFQYKGWPSHVALLTRNTFSPFETAIQRMGIVKDTRETVDEKRGLANLVETLDSGLPAIVWADAFSLPYTNLPFDKNIWAMMPVVVHGYDGESFQIADRSKVSLQVSRDDLMAARARVKKDRFRIATLSAPNPKKLPEAVEVGIRQCIDLYDGVGAPRGHGENFGFAGYQKWADVLINSKHKQSWTRVFPTGADLYQALAGRAGQPGVFIWIMTWGAAPDAERGMFAEFLEEAAQILNKPKLSPIAEQFRKSQKLWHTLAETALPDEVPVLREARELLLQQRALFIEQGQAATAQRLEISNQLAEKAKIAAATLDHASEEMKRILLAIRECILSIHDAEQEAIAGLRMLFPQSAAAAKG